MKDLPTAFLTLPSPGEGASRSLVKKVRLIALKELLTLSGAALGPRAQSGWATIQAVVQRGLKTDPASVLAAVGSPDVLAPLLSLASAVRDPSAILPSLVPSLLASLNRCSFVPDEAMLWEYPFMDFACDGVGRVHVHGGAKSLLLDAAGLAIETTQGERIAAWDGSDVMSITGAPETVGTPEMGLSLSLLDSNPLSMDEAHPDKSGNAVSLGDKTIVEWVDALNEALALIALTLPDWAAELPATTDRLVPVGFEPELHLSASYREAPGIVYMTLHPDPLTMAEAIIHETQHGKLNRLSWLDPVLHNGYTAWSESPVRPDLRPVMGVLLAVHAFVPVAALHHRLVTLDHPLSHTPRFHERRAEVLAGNAGGLDVVERLGDPTPAGERVIVGLRKLHDYLVQGVDSTSWSGSAMPPG
jgi:HEXXH motif-containing protein